MATKPTVTAIMPAFNAERTIAESIRSALNQAGHCELVELIVVDDASTDDTTDIVRSIADPRVRLIVQPANAGPAAARNRGAAEASGRYLAFLDADDVWLPHKLDRQWAALSECPEATAAYTWVDVVGPDGVFAYPDQRVTHSGWIYDELLRGNFIFSGSNLMVARGAFEQVGGFNESLRAVEDWELNVRLAQAHPFVCVPEVLVHYRQTPGSLSSQLGTMEAAHHQAIQGLLGVGSIGNGGFPRRRLASFYLYLAVRATQQGWHPKNWFDFARYAATAFWYRPAIYLDVLRGQAPLSSMRLSLRELRSK